MFGLNSRAANPTGTYTITVSAQQPPGTMCYMVYYQPATPVSVYIQPPSGVYAYQINNSVINQSSSAGASMQLTPASIGVGGMLYRITFIFVDSGNLSVFIG